MKPVMQTRMGMPGGNCFAACLASLLECSIEDVDIPMKDDETWWDETQKVLAPIGLYFVEFPHDHIPQLPNGTLVILTGDGGRGCKHAVIGEYELLPAPAPGKFECRFKFIHDPFPRGEFIKDIQFVGLLGRRVE